MLYVFGQPYATDSYTVNGEDYPHYTDNCGYQLTQTGNGIYTLTMWVDSAFLTDQTTAYPVVIDPPMQVSKGSVEDTTVSASGSNATSAQLTIGFDGNNEHAVYVKTTSCGIIVSYVLQI